MVDFIFVNLGIAAFEMYQIAYNYSTLLELARVAKRVQISDSVCEQIASRFSLDIMDLNHVILDAMFLVALRQEYSEEEIETDIFKDMPNGRAVNAMVTAYLFEKWDVKKAEINFYGLY